MSRESKVDVLVIGAGPSGTVAASILKQAGLDVRIVEKERFPRFVIGESLLPGCMQGLEAAGFIDAVKAKGFQEKFGAKFQRGAEVCDFTFAEKHTPGWGWTWQVPRAEFDETLADTVSKMGVGIDYETEVTAIAFAGTDSTTTVRSVEHGEASIKARFIVDASGYGRVIPRLFGLDRPSGLPPRKAMFAHVQDPRRGEYDEPRRIIIISHGEGIWAWVIPFSNGTTSVGFVGDPAFFDQFRGTREACFRSILAAEVNTARRFADVPLVFEPRVLEGWSVTTDRFYGDGFVLTGNVTEFLDPIFSSGVTLAVASGHRAALLVARQLRGEPIDWQREFVEPTMQGVDTFRTYVNAWYDGSLEAIIYAPESDEGVKRMICSVLAGYVWDLTNPYVRQHQRAIKALATRIRSNSAG